MNHDPYDLTSLQVLVLSIVFGTAMGLVTTLTTWGACILYHAFTL